MADTPKLYFVSRINLLRTIAVAGIFFHHLWNGIPGMRNASALTELLHPLFMLADQGVGVFNIVTGFVLAWPYLGPGQKSLPDWADFQKKRFFKIIPAYYLSLCVLAPATMRVYGISSPAWLVQNLGLRLLFLQSWNYQSLMSNMAAYWWLGLLAQFYLCFPLLLRIYHRFGPARTSLGIMAACWTGLALLKGHVLYWQDSSLGWLDYMIYFNLPARLPEFAIGMWLAAAWRQNRAVSAGPLPFDPGFMRLGIGAAIFFLIGLMLPELPLPLGLVYNAARCLICVGIVFTLPQADRWGAYRPVAFIAGASYSIYLIHQPLQGFMHEVFKAASPQAEFILQSSITLFLVFALAVLLDKAVGHKNQK